ncbi:discoidin domain-containing protein [Microbacterium sp. NPDC057741]
MLHSRAADPDGRSRTRKGWRAAAAAGAVLTALTLAPLAPAMADSGPKVLYVAPDGAAGACRIDKPCALDSAKIKAREHIATGATRAVVIELADGRYPRSEPLVLDARDSGRADAPVVWRAAPGAHPVLDGGVPVTDWKLIDAAAGLWQGAARDDGEVRQLFADGTRLTRAQGDACSAKDCVVTKEGITGPGVAEMLAWSDAVDLEASVKIRWRNLRCGVDHVAGDTLVMSQPCWKNSSSGTNRTGPAWDTTTVDSSRYSGVSFFTGASELVDQPGEFAWDSAKKTVTYKAREGEDPRKTSFVTPRTETLLKIDGTTDAPVHDVRFKGIGFEHAAYTQPSGDEGYASMQAGLTLTGETGPVDHAGRYYTKPASAVLVRTGRDVVIDGGSFQHLGGAGAVVEQGSQGVSITGNRFEDLSSGAIYTGDTESNPAAELESRGNTYERNTILHPGLEYTDAVAIWGGYEAETSISHNTIEYLPYSGISLGWGWNQAEVRKPFSRDNHIDGNRIVEALMPWSEQADGGSIYTQAPQPGTTISGNYIHKTTNNSIYLDEQSSYIEVSGNVITGVEAPRTWLSNWASYGIKNVSHDNWASAAYRKMSGTGSTQHDDHESLTWLPAEAVVVAAAAGATPPGEVFQMPRLAFGVTSVGAPFDNGATEKITAKITNASPDAPLDTLKVSLEAPEGWTVSATTPVEFTEVAGGGAVNVSWTVVPTIGSAKAIEEQAFTVRGAYTSADGDGELASENRVYVSKPNISQGKEATQSSTYVSSSGTTYPARLAVDGNIGNFSHTAATGDPQPWLQVDLGASKDVDAVALWNRVDCCQERVEGVYIFVSDTPFTSEDPTVTAGTPGVWATFFADRAGRPSVIDVGAKGRYVRIQLDSDSKPLNLAELQVFGS